MIVTWITLSWSPLSDRQRESCLQANVHYVLSLATFIFGPGAPTLYYSNAELIAM